MVKRLRRFLVAYRAYAIRPYTFVAITQPKNFGYKVRQSFAYPNAVVFRMLTFSHQIQPQKHHVAPTLERFHPKVAYELERFYPKLAYELEKNIIFAAA